ncbi:hypothetical protein AB0F43_31630 [Kribbella sp. NPDC023972]|uniref:hypothetical protein n=1 Tax=Kribbella sp. NPDC023972 TaxID=3154795 RepID=UPI0033C41863
MGLSDEGSKVRSALHALPTRDIVDVLGKVANQAAAQLRGCSGVRYRTSRDNVEGADLVDLTAGEAVEVFKQRAQIGVLCEALRLRDVNDVVNQPLGGTSRHEDAVTLVRAAAARLLSSD